MVPLTEKATGKEIVTRVLTNIKGIGLDVDRACAKAYENAAKEIRGSVVPEIMKAIQM